MLEKTYEPAAIEARLYTRWEESGAFRPSPRPEARPFTMVIPPPNVTGSLHMGHALNNTIQDVLARFERMRGRAVLWQPGTDHAGIATQMVVERQLAAAGEPDRHAMGRDAFIERIWRWKEESGGRIVGQLRRLGATCDWSRERFTMDEGLSAAVQRVFIDLHREGLIYRDERLVNWDTALLTAISDLEVENREVQGFMWYIRYPVEGSETESITVATTRPETMLGDMAVAVHPEDERYRHLIGRNVVLPLVGRAIPVVGDTYSDPEKGTGAVKITPAHDFNDFEVGRRHGLGAPSILDQHGCVAGDVPAVYLGLERFEARSRIVADLEAAGLLERTEKHTLMQPFGDRSGTVIEPRLTMQWYVDAKRLAEPALDAVRRGETVFVPANWSKTYFDWLENIQPWCISRQLWWGHRIPAWHAPDGTIFVAETEEDARAQARARLGEDAGLVRDPDVLDTWFSSALWPFSTLGWPEETPELARHYPTDVLVTGFDIIFFWVARMMMAGIHERGQVPFHTVYIHALVRDEKGQKMSKSKGNVIDPLDLIERFGADALRFTLCAMAAQGRDVKMSTARVEGYRNFATKLWNAARFCQMNECRAVPGFRPDACGEAVNRWIVGEVERAGVQVTQAIEAMRFNDAAGAAYQFTWGTFCDWYLEFIKPHLTGGDETARDEARATAAWVLDRILVMLHPFMPFITEELWLHLGEWSGTGRTSDLITAPWPPPAPALSDPVAAAEIGWVVRAITEIRAARSELRVPAAAQVPLVLVGGQAGAAARATRHATLIQRLARLSGIETATAAPRGSVQIVLDDCSLALVLDGVIDFAGEAARLAKDLDRVRGETAKLDTKLANPGFLARAEQAVIDETRERREESAQIAARLEDALARLRSAAG